MQGYVQRPDSTFYSHRGTTRQPSSPPQVIQTKTAATRAKTSVIKKRIGRDYLAAKNAIAGHIMRPHPAICAIIVMKVITENSPELFEDPNVRNLIGATERLVRMDRGKLKAYSAWRLQWDKFASEPSIKAAMTPKVVEAITDHLVGSEKLILLDKSTDELQKLLRDSNITDFADCFCGTTARSSREKELAARRQDFLPPDQTEMVAFAK